MDNITRVCRKCGQEKPLEEFMNDKNCVLGHTHTCKQCNADQSRKMYKNYLCLRCHNIGKIYFTITIKH